LYIKPPKIVCICPGLGLCPAPAARNVHIEGYGGHSRVRGSEGGHRPKRLRTTGLGWALSRVCHSAVVHCCRFVIADVARSDQSYAIIYSPHALQKY